MPVLPVCILRPLWDQFATLLPARPAVAPSHPLSCHRARVPDRVVFEHVLAALVHGSGYERIASAGCSDRTIRRRVQEWAATGLAEHLHTLALCAYDRMIGLDLEDLAVDGCITKAPSGGEVAGRSPVDRGKQGLKRSTVTDATGIPLHLVATGANRHDSPLLGPTLADAGRPRQARPGGAGPTRLRPGASGPRLRQRPRAGAAGHLRLRRGHRPQGRARPAASRGAVGGRWWNARRAG